MKKAIIIIFCSAKIFSFGMFSAVNSNDYPGTNGEPQLINEVSSIAKVTIEQTSAVKPEGFYLGQKFTNRNNTESNIYFSIPKHQHVKLVLLNILGQQIHELYSNNLEAGTYKLKYDSSELPGGMYVYRLQSEDFNDSGKLLLVK